MHPIREDRDRRRLTMVASVPEQIARELVTHSVRYDNGRLVRDEIIRVNFHCNQACTFCFVSTHLPAASDDDVEAAIRAAGARGSHIVLSGGEPTLNRRLPDYLRLARTASGQPATLQTNAVRLDDRALVDALAAAGVSEAFVSLHGATAEISDAITEAPGTFVRTVRGIDNLLAAGIPVVINFVICEANRLETPAIVRLGAARWPKACINFSFVAASTDLVPRDRGLIPRYSDVLPPLAEAAAEAERLGVELVGFESMCGLPLCLVPQSLNDLGLGDLPTDMAGEEFLHTEACAPCQHRTKCWGIRRGYAELYGTSELRTVI
jgi:pyruvate-formate lyase-activating enzyme